MSFFRKLENVVSSQIFTKPNNYLLTSKFRINYLQTSSQGVVEHAHTVKSLIQTILQLENNRNHKTLAKYVVKDLTYLNVYEQDYSKKIAQYVYKGGNLTALAIANIYYSAQRLNFTTQWLQNNVHHNIPSKIAFMTKENLTDVLSGLQKYHKESPYLNQIKQRLANCPDNGQVRYVEHQANESSKFLYTQNSSNNTLIQSLRQNSSEYKYLLLSSINNRSGYALHNDL